MTKNIISTFSIYDATGTLITSGLQLAQAIAIKTSLAKHFVCKIKFQAFTEVSA